MELQLYPWQKECLAAWESNAYHGIVNVVTGAGKTVLALAAVMLLKEKSSRPVRVKIVVPTLPLASQWAAAMRRFPGLLENTQQPVGFYSGSRRDIPEREYMLYIINSARYALARHILADFKQGYCVLLIADECHHYGSEHNRKIFDFLSNQAPPSGCYCSLGLSATPQSSQYDAILVPALGKEIYHYGFSEASVKNTICRFSVYQIALSFFPDERATYEQLTIKLGSAYKKLIKCYPHLAKLQNTREFFYCIHRLAKEEGNDPAAPANKYLALSYRRKELSNLSLSRISCAKELIAELYEKNNILIFSERISQAEEVCHQLNEIYPHKVGCYHSKMSAQARKNTLDRFRDGTIRILVSCRALDEGVDVPDAGTGIVLSGSAVSRQHIQRLGRILRKKEGKHAACLYYLYIRESSDDSAYLTEQGDHFTVCNLSYSPTECVFCHPAYEETASLLLKEFLLQKQGSPQLEKEMRICLQNGLIRPDWLLTEDECLYNIENAHSQRERNYWYCMKQMAVLRGGELF